MKTHLLLCLAAVFGASTIQAADESGTPQGGKRHARHASAFQKGDTDGDGKLSSKEFAALQSRKIERRFKKLDRNGDGFVEKDEFDAVAKRRK
jgi:Ca2+-binding EF-hand superfamily protein